jgi:hypothetical protein
MVPSLNTGVSTVGGISCSNDDANNDVDKPSELIDLPINKHDYSCYKS